MKNSKIEFDDNIVEVIKTEKGYEVKLSIDNNVEVLVNNECIYSEYEGDIYKYIPVNMRAFVKEHSYDMGNIDSDEDNIYVEISLENDITMYFPKNKRKCVTARFTLTDELKDILVMVDDYSFDDEKESDLVKSKITNEYNKMIKGLKELGFELFYSHSMNDGFWGWHDLRIQPKQFNEDCFVKASRIIFAYDNNFGSILKKHKII